MRNVEPIYRKHKATGEYALDPKSGERRLFGWQVRVPKPLGGMAYKRFKTKREAERYAAELEGKRSGGARLDLGMTWDAALPLFRREHYTHLTPSSVHDYDRHFARIGPYLKGRKICDITVPWLREWRDAEAARIRDRAKAQCAAALAQATQPEVIQRLRKREAAAEGKGVAVVNKTLRNLSTFLKWCRAEGFCSINAAEDTKRLRKPRAVEGEEAADAGAIYTVPEVDRAIQAAQPRDRAAIAVLFFGGLRLGELLGLTWGDVELDAGRLFVRRQLCAVSGKLRAPKSKAGRRFVELPPFVLKELRRWKLACPSGALELVFPNADGAPQDQSNFHNRVWRPTLRRAGLRHITVHSARHACASMLIATGADVLAVSRHLGHRDPGVTLKVYAHWFARRSESGLGARMAELVKVELEDGCAVVAQSEPRARKPSKTSGKRAPDRGLMSPLH